MSASHAIVESSAGFRYKHAIDISEVVTEHLQKYHKDALMKDDQNLAPIPSRERIAEMTDTTFWASLGKEEGRSPKISIAYVAPEMVDKPLIFVKKLPFTTNSLIKLAPAVERSGIHLGVWVEEGELFIWGTTRMIPRLCFVLEVVDPGVLVVKHRRIDGYGKYVNVAVLKGDQVKIIDEKSGKIKDCPSLINTMIGSAPFWKDSHNILVQLAISMRDHGRGGILLVVPSDQGSWRESIIHPISYAVEPPFTELADVQKEYNADVNSAMWQSKLANSIYNIAGLTAVDGATIINDQYELLAFGAKIGRSPNGEAVEEMLITEPVIGHVSSIVHPVQNGGTRHLSAAQFIHDQRKALALVASQDGRFTIFSWSHSEQKVQAHRVDSLLM